MKEHWTIRYLYIIRGLPGSGKSTYAQSLLQQGLIDDYCEADMYFMKYGIYRFDGSKIGTAHEWCQEYVYNALMNHKNVAVSNTFTRFWEMLTYIQMAKDTSAKLKIVEMTKNYGNIHGVPLKAIQSMRDRWEPYEAHFDVNLGVT